MAKPLEGDCWFKRTPTPEGTPESPDDWEAGTLHQLDQHGTHGYAALVSAASGSEILVIPFKDVWIGGDKPQPKDKGGSRHEAIEHPKAVLKAADPRQGLGHR